MIDPALASIIVNPYNCGRSVRETIDGRLLEATTILKRDGKRWRVVARSSVDSIFCGDKRFQETECAS